MITKLNNNLVNCMFDSGAGCCVIDVVTVKKLRLLPNSIESENN